MPALDAGPIIGAPAGAPAPAAAGVLAPGTTNRQLRQASEGPSR
eukprot:CAMPEP_0171983078 /NCGR_PEP_ID=MMETSP0993-20121228/273098_1 /TAXON_ID=483369 /ORGANISM="non described non described, Strain CCMP2098" /LENGTH=43 /DNA_ID= /DNA_START= /DNA_END= /DNA_ORIENTATION=